jgi:hypothetical protein
MSEISKTDTWMGRLADMHRRIFTNFGYDLQFCALKYTFGVLRDILARSNNRVLQANTLHVDQALISR